MEPMKLKWRGAREPMAPCSNKRPEAVERERQVAVGGNARSIEGIAAVRGAEGVQVRSGGDDAVRAVAAADGEVERGLAGEEETGGRDDGDARLSERLPQLRATTPVHCAVRVGPHEDPIRQLQIGQRGHATATLGRCCDRRSLRPAPGVSQDVGAAEAVRLTGYRPRSNGLPSLTRVSMTVSVSQKGTLVSLVPWRISSGLASWSRCFTAADLA